MPEVRPERTGWRDAALSQRHRAWGFDCPAVDIDFLLIEYDNSEPVALVEYKHERAQPIRASHPSIQAIAKLGARAALPVFLVRYAEDISWWQVSPLNHPVEKFVASQTYMSELEWIDLLYAIRSRPTA